MGATDNIRDIMSYPCSHGASGSATALGRFANPSLVLNGVALGTSNDNCARAISETASRVGAFKTNGETVIGR